MTPGTFGTIPITMGTTLGALETTFVIQWMIPGTSGSTLVTPGMTPSTLRTKSVTPDKPTRNTDEN